MKKVILGVIVIYLGLLCVLLAKSFAHPGRTDANGCHHCWTNCAAWGLSYGQYHCH